MLINHANLVLNNHFNFAQELNRCFVGNDTCSPLQTAISNYDIATIKYVSKKLGIDYFKLLYGNLLYEAALGKAKAFKDLESCKLILEKYNKPYPESLYSELDIKMQLNLAHALSDLSGIKYIYGHELDYTKLYSEAHFSHPAKALLYAIELGDIHGVKSLNHQLNNSYLAVIIKYAYYKEQLAIAKYIVTQNIKYEQVLSDSVVPGLARPNSLNNYSYYIEHLDALNNNLSFTYPFFVVNSLINTMLSQTNYDFGLSSTKGLIYSDTENSDFKVFLLNERTNILHHTVKEVMDVISINSITHSKISFLLPTNGTNPFFHPLDIKEPYKDYFIYLPLSKEHFASLLIHEMCHALFFILLDGNGRPYKESNVAMFMAYKTALNETITNIISNFTKGKYHDYNTDTELLFLLNYWHLSNTKKHTLTNYTFKRFSKNDHYNVTQKEELLELEYQKQFQELEWTDDLVYVMNRIFDYLTRPHEEKQIEFLVRIPELYAEGINDKTMLLFNPAIEYWSKFITPIIQDYINEHSVNCQLLIKNNTLENCVLSALSPIQHGELLVISAEIGCVDCIKTLNNQTKVISNIDYHTKKLALSQASYKINFCVKYCYNQSSNDNNQDEGCDYVDPTGFWHSLIWMFGDILYKCTSIDESFIQDSPYLEIINILYKDVIGTANNFIIPEIEL